jgi:hypothetical protein
MYKQRLESWGYFKNCTEERVRDVLQSKPVRCAVGKASTFGQNGKERDQKIKKYLKRTKKTILEFIETEDERDVRDDTISTPSQARILNGSDTDPNPTNSQSTQSGYENNCPYRPWAKKFRLIENFPR